MKTEKGFKPEEIIFAATSACNLKCQHCFVSQNPNKLNIESAVKFISDCKDYCDSEKNTEGIQIEKIGFSGGEPFLYLAFLCSVIKAAVEKDFMFDRLMTNGVWWNSEDDLKAKLNAVYEAGFDGKIGLSWDAFHNQDFSKVITFISAVHEIFGENAVEIQSVIKADDDFNDLIDNLANKFECSVEKNINKKTSKGIYLLQNDAVYLPVYREPQTFQCNEDEAWQAKKWFKDDYCQGPGNVLYIHADGNIAPCCGFANEEKALSIGNINMTFEDVLNQAKKNQLVQDCYNIGLGKIRKTKEIKSLLKTKTSGKTDDLCTFCQFVCHHKYL